MRPRIDRLTVRDSQEGTGRRKASRSLQITLWTLWTVAVLGTAGWVWAAAARAHRPVSLVALVVYCALVGLVGLIVMTKIEMHLEPWRFMS